MHTYQVGGGWTDVEVVDPEHVLEHIINPVEHDQIDPGAHALVIGDHGDLAYAIVDTLPEIRRWLVAALAQVDRFNTGVDVPGVEAPEQQGGDGA